MTSNSLRALPAGVFPWAVVAVGGLIVGVGSSSPALAGGAPLATGMWLHWSRYARSRSRADARRAEVIDVVDQLIQHLRSGGSLRTALQATGGARLLPEVGLEDAGMGRGGSEAGVELRLFSSTVTVLVERGGPAVPSLERLSDVLRSTHALRAELDLHAGQATASVATLVALPAIFIMGLILIDESLRHFYLFEVGGAVCLLGAVLLSYVGWWVMHRLIASSQ